MRNWLWIVLVVLLISVPYIVAIISTPNPEFSRGIESLTGHKILDVPFVHQKPWFCSEASASMVLQYYGYNLTQDQINAMGFDRFENMLPLLEKYIPCRYAHLTFEDVKKEIDEGDPIIARISLNGILHSVVIVGYSNGYLIIHDPAIGPFLEIDPQDFYDSWRPTNNLAIVFDKENS